MRLNLGCGLQVVDGWVNFDLASTDDRVMRGNMLDGLPFEADAFVEVYISHVLHMFTFDEARQVLKDIRRVLHMEGELRVVEFDPFKAYKAYMAGEMDFFPISDELEPTDQGKFCRMLTWHSTRRSLWTTESMYHELENDGFAAVWKSEYGRHPLDQREAESFFMQAA